GYELPSHVIDQAAGIARDGTRVTCVSDPLEAVAGADAIYTDVWTSMGQEKEARTRQEIFAPYQVTSRLMAAAAPRALSRHCLPANGGEEGTSEALQPPGSVFFDQGKNRLHAQKALLLMLLG